MGRVSRLPLWRSRSAPSSQWRLASGAIEKLSYSGAAEQNPAHNGSSSNIAGGGIGGLATALTLHQIGVPAIVFEAVRDMRPLGVGINLQPNAVRELYDLGFTEAGSRPRRPARTGMGAGRAKW